MRTTTTKYRTTCHRCKAAIGAGQYAIQEGRGIFSHPVCIPNEAECNFLLESLSASEIEREATRREAIRAQAAELLRRSERVLFGTARDIGQTVMFMQDEDLFSGKALERAG